MSFTCVVTDPLGTGSTRWNVTTPDGESSTVCVVLHNLPVPQTCGPDGEFSSSLVGQNGDNYISTLNVSDDFNGTTVECGDQGRSIIDSENICIVGESI